VGCSTELLTTPNSSEKLSKHRHLELMGSRLTTSTNGLIIEERFAEFSALMTREWSCIVIHHFDIEAR
jgi:hypothetical protein